jgi:hypothetical protein
MSDGKPRPYITEGMTLPERQREALAQVMLDAFGAHIQSGWLNENEGSVYVIWRFGPNLPLKEAHISPRGAITYG